jgi:hypothetical protein
VHVSYLANCCALSPLGRNPTIEHVISDGQPEVCQLCNWQGEKATCRRKQSSSFAATSRFCMTVQSLAQLLRESKESCCCSISKHYVRIRNKHIHKRNFQSDSKASLCCNEFLVKRTMPEMLLNSYSTKFQTRPSGVTDRAFLDCLPVILQASMGIGLQVCSILKYVRRRQINTIGAGAVTKCQCSGFHQCHLPSQPQAFMSLTLPLLRRNESHPH